MENHQQPPETPSGGFRTPANAVKIACVGMAAGVILRVIQMLYFFDYDAGFSTDNGFFAWVGLGVAAVLAVAACVCCFGRQAVFGAYVPRKNPGLGVFALLSGALLIASGVLQATDYMSFLRTGISTYDAAERGAIHVAFFVLCFLFGAFQLAVSAGFFSGRDLFRAAPLLHLTGVFWGTSYLLLVYVFYAKSPSFVENVYAVAGGAALLLALFYLCEVLAGVSPGSASRRLYVYGLFAVILNVTYSFSNLTLLVLGKKYVGEINPMIQLSCLGVALYLLVFLLTFRPVPVEGTGRRFRKE